MNNAVMDPVVTEKTSCFHCGNLCEPVKLEAGEHSFCCEGCLVVYRILSENGFENYYSLNPVPGTKAGTEERFQALDSPEIAANLYRFRDGNTASVIFNLPAIHCSSCLWLLENLQRLDQRIIRVTVNFPAKEAHIYFQEKELSLKDLALLLQRIGYPPRITAGGEEEKKSIDYSRYIRLGVAGFCFGNVMLFSFPEYLGISASDQVFRIFFSTLNMVLAFPVFFYSGWPFLKAAWTGLKEKQLNIDVPIALGLVVMLVRSFYEIISQSGHGYIDSLAALVFFMLLGRLFQDKSYRALSFEHDYKSFFPLAVSLIENGKETTLPLKDLKTGQFIRVRSHEIIPADAVLREGTAMIDFSFVTGEPAPVRIQKGEVIYAGGRQTAGSIELEVIRPVSKGYLSTLWENDIFKKPKHGRKLMIDKISRIFTPVILAISLISGAAWWLAGDVVTAINAATAVLIIACPCALALSGPFAYGNSTRILARKGLYLRNSQVIESLSAVDMVVLDKTGTLTDSKGAKVTYQGSALSESEETMIAILAAQSLHPLSRAVAAVLPDPGTTKAENVLEVKGKGIKGTVNGIQIRLGSSAFTGTTTGEDISGRVYISVDGRSPGCFIINQKYRENITEMLSEMGKKYEMAILSGDSEAEKPFLKSILPAGSDLHFKQKPEDKLKKVEQFREKGKTVLMAGDGLNDSGALKAADFGLSVAEDSTQFTPSSEGIIAAGALSELHSFLEFSKASVNAVKLCVAISFAYNLVGLYYAATGVLSPVFAAILMPLSSVSVVALATILTHYASRRIRSSGFRGITG